MRKVCRYVPVRIISESDRADNVPPSSPAIKLIEQSEIIMDALTSRYTGPSYSVEHKHSATISVEASFDNIHVLPQSPQLIALLSSVLTVQPPKLQESNCINYIYMSSYMNNIASYEINTPNEQISSSIRIALSDY